ncbi:MAG: M15 family metallopeptidase [Polaromonas sp.]
MFGLIVISYFLLACFLVWAMLFPEGRAFAIKSQQSVFRAWQKIAHGSYTASGQTLSNVSLMSKTLLSVIQPAGHWIAKYKWGVFLGLLLVTLPPTWIVLFSSGLSLNGFTDDRVQINSQVTSLLKGEQLVPPAPLPPDIFIAAEVEQIRPLLQTASRNWQLLEPEFAQRLLLVFKIMREQHGYEMAILEGYRSPERQDLLAQMGASITNAKAFQSYHQYGLAADCAFLLNGKLVISEKDAWAMKGYALYGQVSESVGLRWGGRWKMLDFGHIEWRKPGVMKQGGALRVE